MAATGINKHCSRINAAQTRAMKLIAAAASDRANMVCVYMCLG